MLLVAGSTNPSYGQKRSRITGYVTDAKHYPVIDAILMVDDKQTGIITDENGYYKVRVKDDAKAIGVFSYSLGTLEEAINGRTRINFTFQGSLLEQDFPPGSLTKPEQQEKINIGYGSIDRDKLTTSISKLDGTNPKYASYSSIYDMLQGTVPGVFVNGNNVLIRGITSFFLSNEPLYVVNGIPVASIDDISPQMVKSIEVLKGSASTIYGSRGANGAILIDLYGSPEINNPSFTVPNMVPFVYTREATNIMAKTATLNGTVTANDLSCFVAFEYGETAGYGNKIEAAQSPVAGSSHNIVSAILDGLEPGKTYHFRVVATNSQGSTEGVDIPFTTPGEAPSAKTAPATNISPGAAQLNGTVNPQLLPTIAIFEYGTTSDYGSSAKALQDTLSSASSDVSVVIKGLKAGTTYHYRTVATNEKGTAYGDDTTFTAEYTIGEYVNGGLIFYIDKSGEHGLVCAPSDQSQNALWGSCIPPGAAGKANGTGNRNTADIVKGCQDKGTAAGICNDLELNGYNDWFLPSVDELFLMYSSLHETGLGDFSDSFYWSSTQDSYGAWVVSFFYGSKSNHAREENSIRTRAVRAF